MKRFLLKLSIFLSPILLLLIITAFFVPVNAYYFRLWESLQPKKFFNYFSGPFYPSMNITMTEKGDLAPHTDLAVAKDVTWQTDRYGYRTTNANDYYDIVIVGDSNIVGTGLTQSDILSEVLARQTGLSVYPYAPRTMEDFLQDPRFVEHQPKLVIYTQIERSLSGTPDPERQVTKKTSAYQLLNNLKLNSLFSSAMTFLDRSFDPVTLLYLKKVVTGKETPPSYAYAAGQILFLQGGSANLAVSSEQIRRSSETIIKYRKALQDRGITMIFLPIPNKENIYYKLLPIGQKPEFLSLLITELKKNSVDMVDSQALFTESYEKDGLKLYHNDDTHWNANGVKAVANALFLMLNK